MVYQEQIDNQQLKENEIIPYWRIFKQAFPQLFNVFFIFLVTLSLFPAVHSGINKHNCFSSYHVVYSL